MQTLADANHYQAIFSQFEKWSQHKSSREVFNDPKFFAYLDTAGKVTHQLPLHIEFIQASFMNYHLSQDDLHDTFFGNFS